MTIPTHILAGLIIGQITNDYPTAIIGSLLIDIDHILPHFRHGILFKPRQLFRALTNETDPWDDQRNIVHSFLSWAVVSTLAVSINRQHGITFSLAYFFHLVLDALDKSTFYPFFPSKKFAISGVVRYYSRQEVFFAICLLTVLISLYLT
jgi:membrane-bound metal-dependent hydrolase YbcI (DUF457 family)